jgi:Domain of unknown function (DUF4189)
MVNLRVFTLGFLSTLVALPGMSKASDPLPTAPAEVMAAAPQGTHLLAFKTSGDQADADAIAVFESVPDKDGVTYRDLVIFGKENGKFNPEVTSDKLIACSKCDQFHDHLFFAENVKVSKGRIHIDQPDGGERESNTVLEFARTGGAWRVVKATRRTVKGGWGEVTTETLPLPASGLVKDMDAKWTIPVYLNFVLVNHRNGKFMFLHGHPNLDEMWASQKGECDKQSCAVLVQQQDGCMSLVRDDASRSFGGSSADPKGKQQAVTKAMDACSASGGQACKEVRTDCSKGI